MTQYWPVILARLVLSIDDCSHTLYSQTITMSQTQYWPTLLNTTLEIAISDTQHAHQAENITLTQKQTLSIDNSEHNAESTSVNIQITTQYWPVILRQSILDIQDSLHLIESDSVVLSQILSWPYILRSGTSDNNHVIESDNLRLQDYEVYDIIVLLPLMVDESDHAIESNGIVLAQKHYITLDDCEHVHNTESVKLSRNPIPAKSTIHIVESDSLNLTQAHTIYVDGCESSHEAQVLVLIEHKTLIIEDSVHELTTDALKLEEKSTLIIVGCEHFQVSDIVSLTQKHFLIVSSCAHEHMSKKTLILVIRRLFARTYISVELLSRTEITNELNALTSVTVDLKAQTQIQKTLVAKTTISNDLKARVKK